MFTHPSKLPQKPQISLVEHPEVRDLVLNHQEPFYPEAKREALELQARLGENAS